MGPRCYGGSVNALVLTESGGCEGLLFGQLLAPHASALEGVAGRSERVLTANERRVCVALRGTLPASPFTQFNSRGSERGCSLLNRGLQVRVLPVAQKAAVAQQVEQRKIDRPRINISATSNTKRDGSEYAGSLRNIVSPPLLGSRGNCRRASLIRSANRPESSGGPLVTDYLANRELPCVGSYPRGGGLRRSLTLAHPTASVKTSTGLAGRMVMVTSMCRAGTSGPATIVSNMSARPCTSPGGPKRVGYPRFESRRAVKARSSEGQAAAASRRASRGQSTRRSSLAHLAASPRT